MFGQAAMISRQFGARDGSMIKMVTDFTGGPINVNHN